VNLRNSGPVPIVLFSKTEPKVIILTELEPKYL